MRLNKLTFVDGIIQDKFIDGIPVKVAIIHPSGKNNVRTLIPLKPCIGTTNHNTANTSPTAGDEAHAKFFANVEKADEKYIGAHFFVDWDSITQILPINEVSYNAGDRLGDGNYATISIEICENAKIDIAEENAKKLNASLILTWPHFKVFKHQDWSGKFCPRVILSRTNGWARFVEDINRMVAMSYDPWEKATSAKIFDGTRKKDPITREEVAIVLDRLGLLER